MNKKSFFNNDSAVLTCMVQGDNPDRIKELMRKSIPQGAEAFGIQFEQMNSEYRKAEIYKELFSCAEDAYICDKLPIRKNEGKSDEQLAEELLELADCGAELCDIMGDYFDKQPGEMTYNETAVKAKKFD